jgi:hypothetical protein
MDKSKLERLHPNRVCILNQTEFDEFAKSGLISAHDTHAHTGRLRAEWYTSFLLYSNGSKNVYAASWVNDQKTAICFTDTRFPIVRVGLPHKFNDARAGGFVGMQWLPGGPACRARRRGR